MHTNHANTIVENAHLSPEIIFSRIAKQPGAVWLDSSLKVGDRGDRSFIAHHPIIDISFDGHRVVDKQHKQETKIFAGPEIYDRLEQHFSNRSLFGVGYIDYESSLSFVGMQGRHKSSLPGIRFLFYDAFIVYDHLTESWQSNGTPDSTIQELFMSRPSDDFAHSSNAIHNSKSNNVASTDTIAEYCKAVEKIGQYIYEGDIYQANYTTRFDVSTPLKPYDLYRKLRRLNRAPYSCYLNFGDYQVLSSSPERLFVRQDEHISCGPIKGTIGCGDSENEIAEKRTQLCQSPKDRAELLMIVDLVRNDLGKIAKTGTVKVDSIFRPENYASLIHLVSDISAKLTDSITYKDIFAALLPAGSITGAPKKRAVEIIDELELSPRSIYTGAIGYINGNKADFNLAIRTIVHRNGRYTIAGGGGIVADSQPDQEYSEMLLKVRKLFEAAGAKV